MIKTGSCMSIHERLGEVLSRRTGLFLGLIIIVTVLMFLAAGSIPSTYDASTDPKGPAFEAREMIAEEFPTT